MTVLVVGANGRTGKEIVQRLLKHNYEVKAMVRRREAGLPLEEQGAQMVIADLKDSFDDALEGCDAILSAVGAGMDGDPEEVDNQGVVKLIKAAQERGIERFILVSSMGTTYADEMPPMLKPYLEAKRKSEEVLETSGLDYTIIQPGGLTDGDETGKVEAAHNLKRRGSISRADVALVAVEALCTGAGSKKTFELLAGDVAVDEALRQL